MASCTTGKAPAEHFGSAPLYGAKGSADEAAAAQALGGKRFVGLYFSAHWCGPCRRFTPALASAYEKILAKHGADALEVVFVSADQKESDFHSYRAEMPWVALDPFKHAEQTEALQQAFKVEGFPTFVIVDGATGAVVCKDARGEVDSDPEGVRFPWREQTLAEALSDDVPLVGGSAGSLGELRAKGVTHVALYFSAHWCPPCRAFTPQLAATYKAMRDRLGADAKFEFVFVSRDRDAAAFKEYHETMGFPAVAYEHAARNALPKALGVNGIPSLQVVSLAGACEVVNAKARGRVAADPAGLEFPWEPKPPAPVLVLEPAEAVFDCFDGAIAVLAGEGSAEHVAALTAAATKLREAGSTQPQFMHVQASTAARGKDQCPSGCTLASQVGPNVGCDGCGADTTDAMACRQHNFDICKACYEKVVQVESGSVKLWARIVNVAKVDTKDGAAAIYVLGGLKARPSLLGRVPIVDGNVAEAVAAAQAAAVASA